MGHLGSRVLHEFSDCRCDCPCSAADDPACRVAGAAGRRRALHQPRAARLVPPPTGCWVNWRAIRRSSRSASMSITGTISAGRTRSPSKAIPIASALYANARGDRDVYTPQVVVNGVTAVLGSDKAAIEKAIVKTRRDAAALALPVTVKIEGDRLTASVPDGEGRAQERRGVAVSRHRQSRRSRSRAAKIAARRSPITTWCDPG